MRRYISIFVMLLFGATMPGVSIGTPVNEPLLEKVTTPDATRGALVKLTGSNFSNDWKEMKIVLIGRTTHEAEVDSFSPPTALSFIVPSDVPVGRYMVRLLATQDKKPRTQIALKMPPEETELRVTRDLKEPLKLTAVTPRVVYPKTVKGDETYELNLLGSGFSRFGPDHVLSIVNHGEVDVEWLDRYPEINRPYDKVYGYAQSSRELRIWGFPHTNHQGSLTLRVRIGDQETDPVGFILSRVKRYTPLWVALGLTALIMVIILWLISKGVGTYKISGQPVNFLKNVFLLEKQTNTYSLSKLQFYLWTGVAVFGYSYLTIARSLIQGVFEFANIPSGLPAIILISGATSVTAQGIVTTKGAKGAGDVMPSLADLVSSGGVAVVDRFQFLVWTLLGVMAYLFLVGSSDPANIEKLPKIPEGFLYLMGISSAGYLGGKMTRKPGPIISNVEAATDKNDKTNLKLNLSVQGSNLSVEPKILIDDVEILRSKFHIDKDKTTPEEPPKDKDFARKLIITIMQPKPEWLANKHKLTLVNGDSQLAVYNFESQP